MTRVKEEAMSNTQPNVEIGYPEFRSLVYARYSAPIQEAVNLSGFGSEMFKKPVSELLHKVTGRIACIVSNPLGAVVMLVLNGYGNDAMKIPNPFPSCVLLRRRHA